MKFEDLSQAHSLPDPKELTPEQVKEAIALYRTRLNLAGLEEEYRAIMEKGVAGEILLKELEEIHRQGERNQ